MRNDSVPGVGDLLKYVAGELKAAAEGQMSPSLPPQQRRQTALLRMLKSGDEPVQWIAIKELGQIGDLNAAGELMPFMTSSNDDLRAAARDALAQIEKRAGIGQRPAAPPPPPPPPGTPVVPPRAKPGTGAVRAKLEMPAPVETEVELRTRLDGSTPAEDKSSQSTFTPLTSVARGQAKPGTGAPRVRLEMPAAVETEREVRARRSDSTLSQERRAQEVGQPSGARESASEERRTAGDKLLPMLINRERSLLPQPAEAATTSASIPPLAPLELDSPLIPEAAELPPV